MRKVALALAANILLMCFGLPPQQAETASTPCHSLPTPPMIAVDSGKYLTPTNTNFAMSNHPTLQPGGADERGPVTADIIDSDEFFRSAIRSAGPARDNTQKIEALLKRMTLEEKVGQMTQLTISMISNGQDQGIQIDPAKLEKAIVRYGVGSILNVADQALPVDRWQEIIRLIQEVATRKTRLGIPVIYGIDSIHGANYVQGTTLFPQEIGMAATWNPELMKRATEIAAVETRAAGNRKNKS